MKKFHYVIETPWRDVSGTIEAENEEEAWTIARGFAAGFSLFARVKTLEAVTGLGSGQLTPSQATKVMFMTQFFYRRFPGAPQPELIETDSGRQERWADVEGNEHWRFCNAIADAIVRVAAEPIR